MATHTQIKALEVTEAQRATTKMLLAMSRLGRHVYGGTVPDHVKAKRRAKSKAARRARRVDR